MLAIIAVVLTLLIAVRLLVSSGPGATVPAPSRTALPIGFLICICANLGANVLTGYLDSRYFVPLVWMLLLIGLGQIVTRLATPDQRNALGGLTAILALLASGTALSVTAAAIPRTEYFDRMPADEVVADCLKGSTATPVILAYDATTAARWSAVHGWNTVLLPRNFDRLSAAEARQFARLNRITHVHADTFAHLAALEDKLPLRPVPSCPQPLAGLEPGGQ